ncbi:MAG: hypothetical protein ACI8QZ_001619 [Chlamydiales bacterium]|jgi:hypothetical protein
MRKILLPCLLVAPLFTSCAAVALGAGSVFVADQLRDNNSYVAQISSDSRELWAAVKKTVSHMSPYPIHVDEALRQVKARYDGGMIYLQVETFDVNQSTLRVRATKYGLNSGELAREVQRRVMRGVEL